MYIQRTAEELVKKLSRQFKVILVTGARQVGKTTLLKNCDQNREFVSLDDLSERRMAIEDPRMFLENHKAPLIIDEIQYAPQLLSYIKLVVDQSDKTGLYWLTGSQQFHMMKNVSESLAGRVGVIDLLGLSLAEISSRPYTKPFDPGLNFEEKIHSDKKINLFKLIYKGFYPILNNQNEQDRDAFYNSYLRTYIERDVRDLTTVSNELTFLTFLQVVAARTGQVLKYSQLSEEVGISQPTAKSWLSILISSNLVYLLPPYYKNITKRMTKMPKIYFLDTGLASYLTGWSSPEVIQKGAMNGAFFETFVISEILKTYLHNGKTPRLYWYRDNIQREIDLLIEKDGLLSPVEIKLSSNPTRSMVKNFDLIENKGKGALICLKEDSQFLTDDVKIVPATSI